jgi:hypothetical protein
MAQQDLNAVVFPRLDAGQLAMLGRCPHTTIKAPKPQDLTVKGKRMVLLGQTEFEELQRRADLWEPALLAKLPDQDSNLEQTG